MGVYLSITLGLAADPSERGAVGSGGDTAPPGEADAAGEGGAVTPGVGAVSPFRH